MARFTALLVGLLVTGLLTQTVEASLPPSLKRDLDNLRNLSSLSFTKTVAFEPVRSPEEAMEAFGMPSSAAQHFFIERRHRLVWQGGRFYEKSERRIGERTHFNESSFDGRSRFSGRPGVVLFRSPPSSGHAFGSFFFAAAGISASAAVSPSSATPLESTIVHRLQTDGRLVSVARRDLDGRDLVEVSLLIPNEIQQRAMRADVAQAREDLQRSITPPEEQERQIEQIYERRNLPPELLEVFYLDPAMNHAAVQIERRYPDGTLLQVTRNSAFVELSDEGVWLPQHSETDLHWYGTNPAVAYAEPHARQVIAIEGGVSLEPVPDDLFTLVYTEPGIEIVDEMTGTPIRFRVAEGEEDLVHALMTLDPRYLPPERLSELEDAMSREVEAEEPTPPEVVAGDAEAGADIQSEEQEDSYGGRNRMRWLLLASILVAGLVGGRLLWKRWIV